MKASIFKLCLFLSVAVAVALSVIYSRHGLRDLRHLQSQLSEARERANKLENENKVLRRQWDLLDSGSNEVNERQIREILGYVKPNELVFLEKKTPGVLK